MRTPLGDTWPLETCYPALHLCPLSQAAGSKAFSTAIVDPASAQMRRQSLVIFASCFLIPLCQNTIIILFAPYLCYSHCSAKSAPRMYTSGSRQACVQRGGPGIQLPSTEAAGHSQPRSLDYPSRSAFRSGSQDWGSWGKTLVSIVLYLVRRKGFREQFINHVKKN